ncbi:MAG: tandem-95 repeat protein, partial [Lutibacter sp.]|uniref:Ig-like domain-containing protein n=1 Tax=Lutibacter sp. TaxID=1925666 RepID=UPI00385F2C8F
DPTTYNAQGTYTVTWTYDDGNGNTSNQTQTVIVADVTAPVADIATLSDATGECSASVTAPTATDNCEGTITGTTTDPTSYSVQGTYTITWTYDDGNGNTSNQTQTVIVADTTAPVADIATLSDVTAQCSITSLTAPTATDNCSTVTVTNDASLPINTQGTTKVTWTYTDVVGNTSTQTQNVVITDTTAPVADALSLTDVTAQCEVISLTPPTATDNCSIVTVINDATLPITAQGTTTVTWAYTDVVGNISTQKQNVVITDNIAPTISCSANVSVNVDAGETFAIITLLTPSTSDNCGVANVTNNAPVSGQYSVGSTTVTWTVEDINGNISTCEQNVTVTDNENPTIVCLAPITVSSDAGSCDATGLVLGTPTVSDNSSVASTVNDAPLTFPVGETIVTWTVTDGSGNIATCDQIVTVKSNPIAFDDSDSTLEDTSVTTQVLSNDTDCDNNINSQSVTQVSAPNHGSIVINSDGTITYTPNPDYNGNDSYEYSVCDLDGNCETAVVTIQVNGIQDVIDDSASTNEDVSVTINVFDNDTFNSNNSILLSGVTNPLNGSVLINSDGTITYTPNPDFNGVDIFTYTVTVTLPDGTITQETAQVIVNISAEEDIVDDTATTFMNIPVIINVLENDSFEGTNHEITTIIEPSSGTVIINNDGTLTYSPNTGFVGTDSFSYTVTVTNVDGTTTFETATVFVTVKAVIDAVDDLVELENDEPIDISIYDNDSNIPTEGTLTIEQPENGTVTIDDNGTPNDPSDDIVTYQLNADFIGDETFEYTICDAYGNCDTATVTIIVVGVLADCIIDFPGSKNSKYEGYGISPNNDGYNDVFIIDLLEFCYPNYQIQIFNRWGNVVFDYTHNGDSYNKPIWWDGKSNGRMTLNKGEVLPAGTYFYILYLNKNNRKPVSGYIYLTK